MIFPLDVLLKDLPEEQQADVLEQLGGPQTPDELRILNVYAMWGGLQVSFDKPIFNLSVLYERHLRNVRKAFPETTYTRQQFLESVAGALDEEYFIPLPIQNELYDHFYSKTNGITDFLVPSRSKKSILYVLSPEMALRPLIDHSISSEELHQFGNSVDERLDFFRIAALALLDCSNFQADDDSYIDDGDTEIDPVKTYGFSQWLFKPKKTKGKSDGVFDINSLLGFGGIDGIEQFDLDEVKAVHPYVLRHRFPLALGFDWHPPRGDDAKLSISLQRIVWLDLDPPTGDQAHQAQIVVTMHYLGVMKRYTSIEEAMDNIF
jgi:hypothetical protein